MPLKKVNFGTLAQKGGGGGGLSKIPKVDQLNLRHIAKGGILRSMTQNQSLTSK